MSKAKDGKMYKKNKENGWFDKRWASWSNEERLAWMVNLRDKLKAKYAKTLNVTQEQLDSLDADVAEMERIVEQEKQAKIQWAKLQAEQEMNRLGDEILGIMDSKKKRSIYMPPKLPKPKNLN